MDRLDAFVATSGTGGTITGTGEKLRELSPRIRVLVVEPQGSPVLSGGQPGPHKLVGTSPGFIPQILNTDIYDEIIQVSDDDAIEHDETACLTRRHTGRSFLRSIGMGGLQEARRTWPGHRVLCMAPDTGERYLSMDIF